MTTQYWMEDIQEAFTRRMLRRVSSRRIRDRDGVFDTSNEDLQRRYSILKAIDDPSAHRELCADTEDQGKHDRSHDLHGRSFDPFENSRNNNNEISVASYNKISGGTERSPVVSPNASFAVRCKKSFAPTKSNFTEIDSYSPDDSSSVDERKARVREGSTEESPKTIARLRNIDTKNRETGSIFESNSEQATRSSAGSLSAAIDELDAQIRNLEMRSPKTFTTQAIVEKCEKMYPVLEDVEFERTGYTLQKNIHTRCKISTFGEFASSDENTEDNCYYSNEGETGSSETYARESSDEIVAFHRTPKSERKMPIMESTRKNSHSDSTKIKFPSPSRVESTISTIAVPATPGSADCRRGGAEERSKDIGPSLNDTIPYEVERFLEEALGDELYNTTVTYAASEARDRTNSHFNASELISEDRTPLRKRMIQALRPSMTEPPPKRSGTLNRSMSIYRSLSQRIKKRMIQALRPSMTEPPPKRSGTLNRSMSIYRSLSQRIKKRMIQALRPSMIEPPPKRSGTLNRSMSIYRSLSQRIKKRMIQALRPSMTEPPPKRSGTLNRSMSIYRSLSQRIKNRMIQALRPSMIEPPPKRSGTLNPSMSIYRSLSQRIKNKFRAALRTKEDVPAPPPISSDARETDRIRQLLQEISVQQTLMNQATKALNVCHTMKEFTESSERVESERLLLLAGLRRKAALEEMKRITSEENSDVDKEFYGERGEITIKDMSLNLRECINRESQDGETIEWFVVVVSQGLEVWATRAVSCPTKDSRMCLPEAVSMPNLTPSFKILVEVYSLKLKRATYNHEEKYRIDNRHKRSSSCPAFFVSPTKMLKKAERPLSPKIGYNHASKNRNTSFVLCGLVELFLHDLSLSSPWPLMLVPANSILQGTIDLSLSCRLHLSVSHEGFLNHGDEAGGFAIWNRRWCVLKGHTLIFWNYPREQETKEPLTIVELINCVSKRIGTADRTICAKPRTLLIETVRRKSATDRNSMIVECRSSCTIVRNLLSCDSVHELMEWSTKLNHVIFALREWNVIGARTQPQVSDL